MKVPRRQFLHLATGAALLPSLSRFALALEYPTRPVRIIVGFAPGGSADVLARLTGQGLSERLGQSFIVENRPGASNNIATEAVVRAAADGQTLLLVTAANAINATLYDRLNFNFNRDIAPVANIARLPFVMLVPPAFPPTTVPEFIAYAKAHPGAISMASAGTGTVPHLAGELFSTMADIHLIHVPFRGGGPALTSLLGGQVQVLFGAVPDSLEYIRTGKVRALAVTTATRAQVLPGVQTVGEYLPGFEASAFHGIGAPKATPAEIVNKLSQEIRAGLTDPKLRSRIENLGYIASASSPAEFGKIIVNETEKWAKIVKFAHIKPD